MYVHRTSEIQKLSLKLKLTGIVIKIWNNYISLHKPKFIKQKSGCEIIETINVFKHN